jgi:isopentenyl-diphosphate delta-isomerase
MATTAPAPDSHVVLCDDAGRPIGTADKSAAHDGSGQLHLAFSVFVFRPDGRSMLIQRRSDLKRLWPMVWANSCCSHPRQGEPIMEAAQRRLREELGMSCELTRGPEFVYRAIDPNGAGVEYEYDVTILGFSPADPRPDPAEVAEWRWIDVDTLQCEMTAHPERFAPWFHLGLPRVLSRLESEIRSRL